MVGAAGESDGWTPTSQGLQPVPPKQRPATAGCAGPGGRRWNTPKELQKLLFTIDRTPRFRCASAGGNASVPSMPPLLTTSPRSIPEPQVPKRSQLTTPSSLPAASPPSTVPSPMRVTRPSPLSEVDIGEVRRPSQATATGLLRRLSSTVHASVSFEVRGRLPGDRTLRPVVVRVTQREVVTTETDLDSQGRPKVVCRTPLLSISDVEEIDGSLVVTAQPTDEEGPGSANHSPRGLLGLTSPAAAQLHPDTERLEFVANPDGPDQILEVLMFTIVRAQGRAYQAETMRLRKSLRPSGSRVLDVVHFNDVYHNELFKTEEPKGGVSRFYWQLSQIRETRNPLVLFSGDFVGPSLMSVITRGKQMVDALNFIGTHYGCFGNHEFDFGLRNLERIIHGYTQGEYIFAGSQTEWIMSNMDGADGQPLGGVTRMKLVEWNGVKVGLLGLCENWLRACPRLMKDEASYRDLCETGEELARELKAKGAAIVIALTHNRLDVDKEVTANCPSIDLLLGGHDHFYKSALQQRVLKSGEEYQWLSELSIVVDESGSAHIASSKAHAIKSDMPEDPKLNNLVQRYEQKMAEKMGKVIGKADFALDSTEEACRFREGHLSNFVADIMVLGNGSDDWKCDFAILGGAAISGKSLKPPGVIVIGDVFNWFPHETKVQRVQMTGAVLRKLLEVSVRELPAEAPSFPHTSSDLRFTINCLRRPPRIEDILVYGKPLDLAAEYVIALTDFVAAGKERFKFIKDECTVLTDSEHAEQLSLWILDYFKQRKGQRAVEAVEEQDAAAKEEGNGSENSPPGDGEKAPTPDVVQPRKLTAESGTGDLSGTGKTVPTLGRHSLFTSSVYGDADAGVDIDDLDDDMDPQVMKKLMVAFGHLSEEIELFAAQEFIKVAVRDLLQCDRATIFLADHLNKQLKFVPDGSDCEISIPLDAGIAGMCATQGKIVNIPDAYKEEKFNQAIDQQTGYRTRNILACPVKRKGQPKVYGVIQAVNKDEELGPFNERDERILMLFGSQAGQHLHHAEIFETMEANQQATRTLLRVARELMQDVTLDLKAMTATIMSGASQLFRCDRSSLYLLDNKNKAKPEMWTIIVDPESGRENIVRLEIGKGIAGHVAATGEVVRLRDAWTSPLFNKERDLKSGYRTQQVLCVPVFATEGSSDVVGVLQFINKLGGLEFTDRDEQLALAFAAFAGLSISNSQEVEILKLQHDETLLQEVPFKSLGRILVKGGWATVRRAVLAGTFTTLARATGRHRPRTEILAEATSEVSEGETASLRGRRSPLPDADELQEELENFRQLRKFESTISAPSWLKEGLQKQKSGSRTSHAKIRQRQSWFGGPQASAVLSASGSTSSFQSPGMTTLTLSPTGPRSFQELVKPNPQQWTPRFSVEGTVAMFTGRMRATRANELRDSQQGAGPPDVPISVRRATHQPPGQNQLLSPRRERERMASSQRGPPRLDSDDDDEAASDSSA
eukprot:TRINITY_DN1652_c0_g1_i11.p1 TRINITY_DN1652_c0_g1~~TRINITY_DN1652_c0_g1_i11.p1  ORF type:complete len:1471 (+),score=479.56 TRINITY_DN1652_c0_g1_i11:56-4468(+)